MKTRLLPFGLVGTLAACATKAELPPQISFDSGDFDAATDEC